MAACLNPECQKEVPEAHYDRCCPNCGWYTFVAIVKSYGKDGVQANYIRRVYGVYNVKNIRFEDKDRNPSNELLDSIDLQFMDPFVSVRIMVFADANGNRFYADVKQKLGLVEKYRGAYGFPEPQNQGETKSMYGFDFDDFDPSGSFFK